jgi:hypothetical protein
MDQKRGPLLRRDLERSVKDVVDLLQAVLVHCAHGRASSRYSHARANLHSR